MSALLDALSQREDIHSCIDLTRASCTPETGTWCWDQMVAQADQAAASEEHVNQWAENPATLELRLTQHFALKQQTRVQLVGEELGYFHI